MLWALTLSRRSKEKKHFSKILQLFTPSAYLTPRSNISQIPSRVKKRFKKVLEYALAISRSLASSFETRHDGHLLGPIARIINNLRTMQMPIFRSVVNLLPLFINAHRPPFAFHLGRWCKQVRNNYSTRSTIGGGRAYVPQGDVMKSILLLIWIHRF